MTRHLLGISAVTASLILSAVPAMAFDDMEEAKRFCKLGATDTAQAITACTAFLEKGDPKFRIHALHQRGMAYIKREWWAPAFADFDAAVKIDPKFAGAWNNRGWTLLKMGRPQEALADFDRALTLKKDEKYIGNREIALKRIAGGR